MKRIYTFLIFASLFIIHLKGQTDVHTSKIFIQVLQPDRDNIPTEAAKQLETKMKKLVSLNGIASDDPINRFVLTSKVEVISKDLVPGPPAKVSMNLCFTFMIGDVIENKVFESVSITSDGVGINENKALIQALQNIKPKNPELVDFLKKAKEEIVEYYNLRCAEIKQDAENEAACQNFDKAIYLLMQVPDVCDCADECKELAIHFNNNKINTRAASLLNQAKLAWASSPNEEGASTAASILATIPGGTSSQIGIDALINEIDTKLQADEKKQWAFKMEQYRNQIDKQKRDDQARLEQQSADNQYRSEQQKADNEHRQRQQTADNEYRRIQQQADNAARTQLIDACRQVGVEYAKNQPKSVTYQRNVLLW